MCTGDAERQREEHVNQEAVEVVEYILVARNTRAVFMYIVNIRVVVSIFLRNIATTFLFYFLFAFRAVVCKTSKIIKA